MAELYHASARELMAAALGCDAAAPALDEVERDAKLYRGARDLIDPGADPHHAAKAQLLALARLADEMQRQLDGLGMMARSRLASHALADVREHCVMLAPAAELAASSITPKRASGRYDGAPPKLARKAFIRQLAAIFERSTGAAAEPRGAFPAFVVLALEPFPEAPTKKELDRYPAARPRSLDRKAVVAAIEDALRDPEK